MTQVREDMVEELKKAPVKWKRAGSGFVGQPGWVVCVDRDEDPLPCWCVGEEPGHPESCAEIWATAFGLLGESREEAEAARDLGEYLGVAHHLADCDLFDEQDEQYRMYLVITRGRAQRVWATNADGSLVSTSSMWGESPGHQLELLESHGRECGIYEAYPQDDNGVSCGGADCLLLTDVEVPERLTAQSVRAMIEETLCDISASRRIR